MAHDQGGGGDRQTDQLSAQLRALQTSLADLDARTSARLDAMQGQLSLIARAIELIHDDDPRARRRLRELRSNPTYAEAFDQTSPLVSVVIPTWNRVEALIERAIPSALTQSHENVEVVVVGDASPPSTAAAVSALGDPRVRFHNLSLRGPYEADPRRAWLAAGTPGVNAGVSLARGAWIAVLGDDDAFLPDHIERLLTLARNRRAEFSYGQIRQHLPDGGVTLLGAFPPRLGQIGLQAAIYHAGLRFFELEFAHALFDTPNDWGMIARMMRAGVSFAYEEAVSVDYWPAALAERASEQRTAPAEPLGRPAGAAARRGLRRPWARD